ncbi:FG-GAP repeat domain-containing protein [Nocardioides sp.]|uniref:FG-GAP repeat domain-containing protein n=1 Tax=Nocardioides sp. TaxID=35761 RepID=UPI003513AB25
MPRLLPSGGLVTALLLAATALSPALSPAPVPVRSSTAPEVTGVRTVRATSGAPAPQRDVPAVVVGGRAIARTAAGSGDPDVAFAVLPAVAGRAVWGDWSGRGVAELARFRQGRWVLPGSNAAPPAVARTLRFGARGDVPLAGDWNGDGRTDLAVSAGGGVWRLALNRAGERRPGVWRTVRLGAPAEAVVVGDWDGTGRDRFGVAGPRRWRLYRDAGATEVGWRPVLGRGTGTAVAGDWDGDGHDGIGVVTGGLWTLRDDAGTRPQVRLRPGLPRTAAPLPWSTVAGPAGDRCPTMRAGLVMPTGAVGAPSVPAEAWTAAPDDVATAMRAAARYALTTGFTDPWGAQTGRTYLDVRGRARLAEYAVRFPAMSALTIAVALASPEDGLLPAGTTRAAALARLDLLLRSTACQHRAITPGGWGGAFQAEHWASLLAIAAWLVWDDLSAPARDYVRLVVTAESQRLRALPDEYWRDRSGVVVPGRAGNSAAEEVAWQVPLLEMAARFAGPTTTAGRVYRRLAAQRAVVAYAVPADLADPTPVNGVALRDRVAGSNVLPSGLVVNHGRVQPDYAGNIQHLWWAADLAVLGGDAVPEAYLAHADLVYATFTDLEFEPGTPSAADAGRRYLRPGGTVYRFRTARPGDLYFPDGGDNGSQRRAPFLSIDAHAEVWSLDGDAAWPAAQARAAHAADQVALIAASGARDGRTYALDPAVAATQDRYPGREEYAGQQVAMAYLVARLREVVAATPISDAPLPLLTAP